MCIHWLPTESLPNRLQGQISNGVHLFFVLSGFLITRILMQGRAAVELRSASRAFTLRQFYARRFLRIFPAYYLALGVGALFHFQAVRTGFWWHASYLSNFYYYHRQNFDGPASLFWTLAVEEQFYLIWPLAILFLPRRWLLPFVLGVAVLGTAIRIDSLLTDSWLKILLPACMNFLAVGSLVAVAENPISGSIAARNRLLRIFAVLIAILACCSAGLTLKLGFHAAMASSMMRPINQPMMSMLYACQFAWVSAGTPRHLGAALRLRPIVYLGKISYGLYLYHLFVTFAMKHFLERLDGHVRGGHRVELLINFAVLFTVTVIIASISWFSFEKPLNDLKRFFPMPSTRMAGRKTG